MEHFELDNGQGWDGQPGRFRMNTRVVKIERHPDGGHVVTMQRKAGASLAPISRSDSGVNLTSTPSTPPAEPDNDTGSSDSSDSSNNGDGDAGIETFTLHADAVAICSGLHVTPAVPNLPGAEVVPESFHSSQYDGRAQVAGKRVMILGCGETGMDLAYESCKAGASQVVLCHRGGYLSFPKVLNSFTMFGATFDGELPIDGLITNLFETAYVHPWVKRSHLRWFVSDFVIKRVLWFLTGTQAGCNQWYDHTLS